MSKKVKAMGGKACLAVFLRFKIQKHPLASMSAAVTAVAVLPKLGHGQSWLAGSGCRHGRRQAMLDEPLSPTAGSQKRSEKRQEEEVEVTLGTVWQMK